MSKYRFKTKKEFIRDGLWDEKDNCPHEWAWDGQMNKYLGKDVPDEFNIHCDENEEFEYDNWLFQNTDYVLKEQQEYFDDLSQHIGRYIRALVDYPHSGGVKKGEIGKIISNYDANFPSQQEYSCSSALSKGVLGVRYELLPEDYSPEQEPSLEFIPEKWYSFNWDWSGKDKIVIAKIKEVTDIDIIVNWRNYTWNKADYNTTDGYNLSEISNVKELSIEEIQPYLPEGHPDKFTNSKFEIGKWYKWYQKNHGKYHYGKVERINTETDTIVMIPWILQCDDYNYSGTFDLSKAEQIQEISVEDVQEFLPKGYVDKISKPLNDKVECTEFKKGEYIVLIGKGQSTSSSDELILSEAFIQNHCYKVKENGSYLMTELDSAGGTTNGWVCIPYNPNKYHKNRNWRYATQEEIDEYERRGKPYNVTELQKKELSMEEIQEECKKRFPIGCTFTNNKGKTNVLRNDSCTYHIFRQTIWAHSGGGCLYENGKWAELVSLPEENITEIPVTYESVSGCFPTDKTMLIYDEVGQYPSISSDYWKNIPKFVEKEFDIYGPTPDIE